MRQRFTIAHEIGHLQLPEKQLAQQDETELWVDRSFRVTLTETGGAR